jgi:hypothetical protein
MRMLCNSTFLFYKRTYHSHKLKEFRQSTEAQMAGDGRARVTLFSARPNSCHSSVCISCRFRMDKPHFAPAF